MSNENEAKKINPDHIVDNTACPRSLDLIYIVTSILNGSRLLGHDRATEIYISMR